MTSVGPSGMDPERWRQVEELYHGCAKGSRQPAYCISAKMPAMMMHFAAKLSPYWRMKSRRKRSLRHQHSTWRHA